MSATILRHVSVANRSPTGRTQHTFVGADVGAASSLRIVRYADDPGFYLVHFDSSGKEIADTYHDSLEEAMEQATWEYGVMPDDWKTATE